jgi:hypoxanthine-DNA glycosylase
MPDERKHAACPSKAAGRRRGFAPVVDAGVRVLVLGSFPSTASLAARQYYGHPRNQFWPILGAILKEPLARLSYPDRLERMLAHGVGLWDVYAACRRAGSLDSQILAPTSNDLQSLPLRAPLLRAVAFNGQAAGRFQPSIAALGYASAVLPSTSPAHATRRFDEKLTLWNAFFQAWC